MGYEILTPETVKQLRDAGPKDLVWLLADSHEALRAENERLVADLVTVAEQIIVITEAEEAEIKRLREALRKWESVSPHHRGDCLFLTVGADGCTCGLQDARDMTRAALGGGEA